VLIGLALGVFVTRPAGADFFDVIADLANFGQTFPPIAVFVLAVPILGFGFSPTVLALTLYGVLPVLFNTIAGIRSLPANVLESAAGMGMRPWQVLWRVELPLAAPVILAGVRVSVVINVSTATLGAIAGAGGFAGARPLHAGGSQIAQADGIAVAHQCDRGNRGRGKARAGGRLDRPDLFCLRAWELQS